jgi:hypothetical protein
LPFGLITFLSIEIHVPVLLIALLQRYHVEILVGTKTFTAISLEETSGVASAASICAGYELIRSRIVL